MADVTTTAEVIQVQVKDGLENRRSFNIDNPASNITTFSQVAAAFKPAIDGGWWINDSSGSAFNEVIGVTLTTTQKIKLENSGVEITLTPPSLTFSGQIQSNGSVQSDVVVTGSTITQVGFINNTPSDGSLILNFLATFSGDTVTLKITNPTNYAISSPNASGKIAIFTTDGTAYVPVTVTA